MKNVEKLVRHAYRPTALCLLILFFSFHAACSPRYDSIIPANIQGQVNRSLSFSQVKDSPTTHEGALILLGGEVLSAKRLKEHTRITILQLPLDSDEAPATDRTSSQGRFIALQTEFLDPATIPSGTRITILGKVTGATTEMLDEMEYTYPTLMIQHLKVWPASDPSRYGYRHYYPDPYWGPYWGRFGGFYRPYPYGYWW